MIKLIVDQSIAIAMIFIPNLAIIYINMHNSYTAIMYTYNLILTFGTNIRTRKIVVSVKTQNTNIPVPILMKFSRAKVTNAMTTIDMLDM